MRTAYTVAKNVLMRKVPENDFLHKAHVSLFFKNVFIIFYSCMCMFQRLKIAFIIDAHNCIIQSK